MRRSRLFFGSMLTALIVAGTLVSGSCTDGLLVRPRVEVPVALALAPSVASAGPDASACARADAARVKLIHDGALVLDSTVSVSGACENGLTLKVRLGSSSGPLGLGLVLLAKGLPLFQGSAAIELQPGRHTDVQVAMQAVPAGVEAPDSLRSFTKLGDSLRLGGAVVFATGDTVQGLQPAWTDDGRGIVAVMNGLAYARAEGLAVLTAAHQAFSHTSAVRVKAIVASVVVTGVGDTAAMRVGSARAFTAVARDSNRNVLRRTFAWTSSNPTVASVDTGGVVHAGANPGTALIVASAEAKADSFALTVLRAPPARVVVTPSGGVLAVGDAMQFAATAYDVAGNPLTDREIIWRSGSPQVATVTASGLVAGVSGGSAIITAACDGVSGYASIRVLGQPILQVTPNSVYVSAFTWQTYGPTPITSTLEVTNAGAGTIAGLSVGVTQSSEGGAVDSVRLSSTNAPATITIFFRDSAGAYLHDASLTVSSTTPGTVPVSIQVLFNVMSGG